MESYVYPELAAHGAQLICMFLATVAAAVSYCFGGR